MTFETVTGSKYEVAEGKIRRLSGTKRPTPRQGEDGNWKVFMSMSGVVVGASVLIGWEFAHGVLKSTLTSAVSKVE